MTISRRALPFLLASTLAACAPGLAYAEDGASSLQDSSVIEQAETTSEVTGEESGQQPAGASSVTSAGTVDEPEAAQPAASGDAQAESETAVDAVEVVRLGVKAAVREFDPESAGAVTTVGLGVCAGVGVGLGFVRGLNAWGTSPVVTHE